MSWARIQLKFFELGPKKIFINVLSGTFLAIFSKGPNFFVKMVDSSLENARGWNLHKKLA
jgi:hypothetical protein